MAKASEALRATLLRVSKVECLDALVSSGVVGASTKPTLMQSSEDRAQYERYSLAKSDLIENLRKFVASGATYKNFHRFLPTPKQSFEWDLILTPRVDSLEALWRDYLISRLAVERIDETAGDIMSRILQVAFAYKEHAHVTSFSSEAVDHLQLERRLLIPQKEFRQTLPQMVASRFVSTTEFSRAKDFNADTVVCLYSVNLSALARLTIEYAQHCILCLATRSDAELNAKSRLVDQRYRVETMVSRHQEEITKLEGGGEVSEGAKVEIDCHKESVQALRNSLTPAELNQLSTLSNRLAKLAAAQWEAETAWFVADLYLRLYFDAEE
ncbi:unnamed protein product [Hydatigera taeniaeformis]|uniref:DNA-directed RNA polymerase III subunit RPC3 n=1 Tax=Hydatigena taeniaeformis TaxID=6205 RepID=A0A0R3WJ48_HYDTA|nr:unnamed protein product [Hydatigera taeniaeformis]